MKINYFAENSCDVTRDGWCATHSEGDGPTYCLSEGLVDAIRRARFHELLSFDRWQQADDASKMLLLEVGVIRDKYDGWETDNEDIRAGIDLVVSALDVLVAKYQGVEESRMGTD